MGFFTRQRYDYAGQLAVKLQKFIIFLFVVSLVGFGVHVYEMVRVGQFWAGPFIASNIAWLILYSGFMGAYRRNTCLLMFFFIVNILGALFLIGAFVLASVGTSLAVLHGCQEQAGCNARAEAPKDVAIITGYFFAITVVPLVFKVIAAVLALVTRREILIARAAAAAKQSQMEEGITIPADEVCSPKLAECAKEVDAPELPQQQMQFVPMSAPFPIDPQAWPQGFQPVGNYSQPVVYYYYPVPTQQQ